MTDIFISYAREDEARIRNLAQALQKQGWSVFWDRRIPAGETWRTYIGRALDEARCVIVAWTHHSVDSNWVLEEAEDAKRRRVLVPILFESIEQPRGFREIQAADLSSWQPGRSSIEFEQLVHDLQLLLKSSPVRMPDKPMERVSGTKPVPLNSVLKTVGIAVSAIFLLGSLFYLSLRIKERQDKPMPPKPSPVETEVTTTPEPITAAPKTKPIETAEPKDKKAPPVEQSNPPKPEGRQRRPTSVTSGSATVFGGNSRYGESGFNFASKAVVAWDSGQADLLVEDFPPAKARFFIQQETKDAILSGSPHDKGARSGIQRVEAASLEELQECPEAGYQYFRVGADEGAIYCVRTRDGQHFAKIQVVSLKPDSITFNWKYEEGGARKFN